MAPFWGGVIGLVVAAIYWPGAVGLLPGLSEYYHLRPLRRVDHWIGDRLHPVFGRTATPPGTPRICVVGVTEKCLAKYGDMPWDRGIHAQLVQRLRAAGARTIAFDIYFPPGGKGNDVFAEACRDAGNVILPRWAYMPDAEPRSLGRRSGERAGDVIPLGKSRAVRLSDGVFRAQLREADETIHRNVLGCGHINVFYDDDCVTRRVPVAVGELGESDYYIPLGIAAALPSLHVRPDQVHVAEDWLECGDVRVPLDERGCILVNFCAPVERFVDDKSAEMRMIESAVPWLEETAVCKPITFFSYADVLEGNVDDGVFKDSVVLIGQRVRGSREDVHLTPYGSEFGVFVQAMVLHNALTGNFLRPLSPVWTVLGVLVLSVMLGALCFSLRFHGSTYSVLGAGGILTGLGVLLMLIVVGLMRRSGLVLEATPFLMVVGFNIVGGTASAAARMGQEIDRRSFEIELLLRSGRRQMARWVEEDESQPGAIKGVGEIALSASLTLHSPEIAAETFWQAVSCEGCALAILQDDETIAFERTILLGFAGALDAEKVKGVAETLAREIIEAGEPVIRSDIDPRWAHGCGLPGLRAFLGVPLFAGGKPLAVALLFNKRPTSTSPEKRFIASDLRLVSVLRYQAAALLENARRYRLEYAMFDGFAQSLAKAVDLRDNYTHGHSRRVAEYSTAIAREMNLTQAEIEIVQRAATLHDVGKIGVSDAVLNKPGHLSDAEFALIQAHAANGYEILRAAPWFKPLLPGIRNHHERYDGNGYPDGLKGKETPFLARIIAAADAYDAMTSDRIYRKALSRKKAMRELERGAGTQFDPAVVKAFLTYLVRKETAQQVRARAHAAHPVAAAACGTG